MMSAALSLFIDAFWRNWKPKGLWQASLLVVKKNDVNLQMIFGLVSGVGKACRRVSANTFCLINIQALIFICLGYQVTLCTPSYFLMCLLKRGSESTLPPEIRAVVGEAELSKDNGSLVKTNISRLVYSCINA
jgi:hypothetical protein